MIYPATLAPLALVKDPIAFRRVAGAFLISAALGLICFVLLPVHMQLRPALTELQGEGFLIWGLKLCYAIDRPSGCFPSLHVTYATIAALVTMRANRSAGRVMWLIAILIDLSTMLVKQHFFADVIAGSALAWGSVWLCEAGLHPWLSAAPLQQEEQGLRPLLYPSGLFALIVGALFTLYLWGLDPMSLAPQSAQ
jgi:membrane-associated phospholipid phosphatase